MPIPLPPETRILDRMKEILLAAPLTSTFGLSRELTVRHYRHRSALPSERPGLALRYVKSEVDASRGEFHSSASETCWAMTVDIVIDLALLPEPMPETQAGDGADVTGWDRLLGLALYAANQFVSMDSPLRMMVDDILAGDVDPDEDSQPDEGRLAIAVIVLYRTLTNDPFVLLNSEENA